MTTARSTPHVRTLDLKYWGAVLTLLVAGCIGQPETSEPYMVRAVTADELIGTWRTTGENDLSQVNASQGLAPLALRGKSITLSRDGMCSATIDVPLPVDASPSPTDSRDGGLRHATDVCLWKAGTAHLDRAPRQQEVAALHITVTRAGYQRGAVFYVFEQEKSLRLWAASGHGRSRLDLLRER